MKRTSPNITIIVLTGLLLFLIAIAAVIAANNDTHEAEEIVFEPVEVELTEGSATLKVEYDAKDYFGFEAKGEDEISLNIIKDADLPHQYIIKGALTSTQSVRTGGLDQGDMCWINIIHDVDYMVAGIFTPSTCKFELSIAMSPRNSTLLSHDCSLVQDFDYGAVYMAPPPEQLVFTKSFAGPASSSPDYSLILRLFH